MTERFPERSFHAMQLLAPATDPFCLVTARADVLAYTTLDDLLHLYVRLEGAREAVHAAIREVVGSDAVLRQFLGSMEQAPDEEGDERGGA